MLALCFWADIVSPKKFRIVKQNVYDLIFFAHKTIFTQYSLTTEAKEIKEISGGG